MMRSVGRRLFTLAALCSAAMALGFLLMLPFAYLRYSSIGLDFERAAGAAGNRWCYTYLRVRWPGEGSVFIGGEQVNIPALGREPDAVDAAATWFEPPRRLSAKDVGGPLGLRVMVGAGGWNGNASASAWVGMPAFLPIPVCALLPLLWYRDRRRGCRAMASAPGRGLKASGGTGTRAEAEV